MLIRNSDGKIIIIFRKDCKNERVYNQKIYDIIQHYHISPKLTNTNILSSKPKQKKFVEYNSDSD
jgi:hypothetical protein